jgi:hypothetical protein
VIGIGLQQVDACAESSQLKNQPDTMGPWATSANDQVGFCFAVSRFKLLFL